MVLKWNDYHANYIKLICLEMEWPTGRWIAWWRNCALQFHYTQRISSIVNPHPPLSLMRIQTKVGDHSHINCSISYAVVLVVIKCVPLFFLFFYFLISIWKLYRHAHNLQTRASYIDHLQAMAELRFWFHKSHNRKTINFLIGL